MLVGLTLEPLRIVPTSLIMVERRIICSVIGARPNLCKVLQLAATHKIRPTTEAYPLNQVNEAHHRVRNNQVRFRTVLTPN